MTQLVGGPSRDAIEAHLVRASLADFIKAAWPIVEPGEPLVWGWHLDAICEHLEAVTRGDIKKLLMNVPPRHMKSLATSVFWPAWEWLRKPSLRYLTVSHSGDLAIRDAYKTRKLMRSEGLGLPLEDLAVYNEGRPATLLQRVGYRGVLKLIDNEWEFSAGQDLKSSYENDRTGVRRSTSIGGGGTGEGGQRVIIDDPEKLEEWDSEAKRKEARDFCCGIAPSRLNSKDGAIVLIMQRLHEEDSTAAVLGQVENVEGWRDVVHLCLPEQFEPAHDYVWFDDPRLTAGELIWPEKFGPDEVDDHKRAGALRYAGNYQQRPSPAEGNVFKREDWRYYGPSSHREDLPPTWERIITSWDLTFGDSDDPGASWVVGQCWGKDGADVYLLAQVRARMSFPNQESAIESLRDYAPLDHADTVGMILIEEKAAGKPMLEQLRKKLPALKGVVPTTSKTARAVAVQVYQEGHNVWLPATVIPAPPGYEPTPTSIFVEEHASFPAGADDQVDVLSQSLQELYHASTDAAVSISAIPRRAEPEVRRGGKILVGQRYVDEEPPEAPLQAGQYT
jgi:predicted phage terminase large subunit-like protein